LGPGTDPVLGCCELGAAACVGPIANPSFCDQIPLSYVTLASVLERWRSIRRRLGRRAVKAMIHSSPAFLANPTRLSAATVMAMPTIAARHWPYSENGESFVLMRHDLGSMSLDPPTPDPIHWTHGEPDAATYLAEGREHTRAMVDVLTRAGAPLHPGQRILDFGCGTGRMMRWLPEELGECELWGVDINETNLVWARDHLGPRFHFAAITTLPHLPFSDSSMDIVYAASVFTQFSQLVDAWLLEISRVLRPGGHLYVTVHDKRSIELILGFGADHRLRWLRDAIVEFDREVPFIESDFAVVSISRLPHAEIVFYDREHFSQRLSNAGFDVVEVAEEAFYFQPGLVCKRRADVSYDSQPDRSRSIRHSKARTSSANISTS
jgi:ubiquinone/menaquinone biosynthesis C-methylase UbiE